MENRPRFNPNPKLKLMEQVREVMRIIIMPIAPSRLTPSGYCVLSLSSAAKTHPGDLGDRDVERFLSHA